MVTWQEIRHQAVIAGRLTDGQTGRPVGRAEVRVTAGPPEFSNILALLTTQHGDRWPSLRERLDRTRTAADGLFISWTYPTVSTLWRHPFPVRAVATAPLR